MLTTTSGTAPAVSTADQARIAAALEASCAANTTRAYRSGWAAWQRLGKGGVGKTSWRRCARGDGRLQETGSVRRVVGDGTFPSGGRVLVRVA